MDKKAKTQFWLEFATDITSLLISFVVSFLFTKFALHKLDDTETTLQWAVCVLCLLVAFFISYFLFHKGVDIKRRSKIYELVNTIKNDMLVFFMFIALLTLTKNPVINRRFFIGTAVVIYLILTTISRYYLKRWLTGGYTPAKARITSYVGVLTTTDRAEEFISGLKEDWSIKITGVALLDNFVDNGRFTYDKDFEFGSEYTSEKIRTKKKIRFPHIVADDIPVIATDIRFIDWIRKTPLDEVFINLPYYTSSDVFEIVEELEDMGVTVHLNVPTLDNLLDESKFDNINCKIYSGYPLATFAPTVHNSAKLAVKRFVDVIGAIVGLIISAPIIAITAIPLLIESPGPLFFKQERVGQNGRLFNIYKLRSMYKDAEERKKELMAQNKMDGLMFKMDNDPRITKVGRVIRKLSIDELPQFFNVLKGDMSLVGTRPPTVREFEQYENRHKRRLSMRPGITGMWQVSGRSNINDFEDVVKLDCEYIDNWCLLLDLKILFKTVKVVLTHEGAE
ncbi:sugar transferase [uncultured Eubacterium sp.]|uniref:sugar transferase n=1 Tax=uncultured Eubacterium sp. TaxID=165185 RepID=UPI0026095D83|nr:sugar transferase [uncultured Eubacterium sp.]